MATQIELSVAMAAEETAIFDLPVPATFGTQSDTFISILTIQPDSGAPPATATYTIRHVSSTDEAIVPATVGPSANIGSRATVELLSLADGLAVIHITHTPAIDPEDEEAWHIRVSHSATVTTDFFGVIGHTQPDTQVPRMALIIADELNPVTAELDYGRATFNVSKTLSVIVFNTGTADFVLDTITLATNPTGFYAISTDPSGNTLSPNGQDPIEIDYTPAAPPPAAPHDAQLSIPSTTTGVSTQTVDITGEAVFREIVLCIDASNSMNFDNAGTALADCPVGSTRAPNFDPDSRIRQVRAALQTFQTKLTEYGDQQTQLGIVEFPGGDLACGSKHPDALASDPGTWKTTIHSLATYSSADPTVANHINTATEDGYFHSTPMKAGLQEAIDQFTADAGKYRAILLLSDGKHNVPDPAVEGPEDLLPTLTSGTRPIRLLAIGFGENGSVDHVLLQDLATQTKLITDEEDLTWSGFFEYNPTAPGNNDLLEGFYNKLFTDIFELQEAVDPTARITAGATNTHPVLVTEFDQRVTFSVSWVTPRRNLLGLILIAPNGERIDPKSGIARYYEGPRHKMYAVDVDSLEADYIGEWQMEVTYPKAVVLITAATAVAGTTPTSAVETYTYDVITRSGLELDVKFDKVRYFTGDRIVVFAHLTENGRPLLNQTVKVQVKRPDQGMGNWYADNPVALETIEKAVAEQYGPNSTAAVEQITPVFKKSFYLTEIQTVNLPARANIFPADGADMHDDGQNGDIRAQDGVYTAVLEDVAVKPDTYAFTVVATGNTGGGNSFRRERTIHLNIQTRIDFTLEFTNVNLSVIEGDFGAGLGRFQAYIRPQDNLGNLWGPGHAAEVSIQSAGARPVTAVVDDLNGGYYRIFEFAEGAGLPLVDFEIQGQSIPTQIYTPPGRGFLTKLPILLSIALILALILILILVLIAL